MRKNDILARKKHEAIRNIEKVKLGSATYTTIVNEDEIIIDSVIEFNTEMDNKINDVPVKSDVIVTSLPVEKGYILMSNLEGTNSLESGFG